MTRYILTEIAGELDPVEFELPGGKVVTAIGDPTQAVWDSLEAFTQLGDDAGPDESLAAVRGLFLAAFGKEETDELMGLGMIAVAAIAGTLSADYAEKAGKAQGSNRASRRGTGPSKRTSNASTKSTSNGRSTALGKTASAAPASPA